MSAGQLLRLPARSGAVTLGEGVARFLDERDLRPSTVSAYGDTLGQLVDELGADTPLAAVDRESLWRFLARWRDRAPATYNRHLTAVGSLFAWTLRQGLTTHDPAQGLERRRERRTPRQEAQQRPISYRRLEAIWGADGVAVRDKTLWKMLYETAARASEVLGLDVDDLDLANRSAVTIGKGGGAERLFWATGTARLLPRLLDGRTTGPVFLASRRPTRPMPDLDVDPTTGRARLSYRRAAQLWSDASGGATLHQLRHSRLTHLAEAQEDIGMLRAKSRHRSMRSLERYVNPSDAAVAAMTARHDHERS